MLEIEVKMMELEERLKDLAVSKRRIEETSDEPIDYIYEDADFRDRWGNFGSDDY